MKMKKKIYSQSGFLSRQFESSDKSNAIGYDETGGNSYGDYQIETKSGTMNDFIEYMKNKKEYQKYYNELHKIEKKVSLSGDNTFKNIWNKISEDNNFKQAQHDFIIDKKYNKLMDGINDIKGINIEKRNSLLKELLISVAVQHGETGGKNIIRSALGNDVSNLSDEDIITRIYDERSNVDRWFKSSSENVKNSVKKRFQDEKSKVLRLLNSKH